LQVLREVREVLRQEVQVEQVQQVLGRQPLADSRLQCPPLLRSRLACQDTVRWLQQE
jgi:hypothetical protein